MKIQAVLLFFLSLSTLAGPCEGYVKESLEEQKCLNDFYTKEVTTPVINSKEVVAYQNSKTTNSFEDHTENQDILQLQSWEEDELAK